MFCKPLIPKIAAGKIRSAGFTLVEILVALALTAAVVPIVSQGLKLAALAGEVSQRKAVAMRIAERILNETIITGQWNSVGQLRSEQAGPITYKCTVRNEPWSALNNPVNIGTANGVNVSVVSPNTLHLLTVEVNFSAQGQNYGVHLSTVVDITRQVTVNTPPSQ
jgi:prepilin-type N-terminal cleavage/methylation domain-containing protein